jgi:hypothetical protein
MRGDTYGIRLVLGGMRGGEVGAGCGEDEGDAEAAEANVGDVLYVVSYGLD